jgi:hypothetical protein
MKGMKVDLSGHGCTQALALFRDTNKNKIDGMEGSYFAW